jgi:prepilin-type N-terminal cleavage/methylation domain-containing protein
MKRNAFTLIEIMISIAIISIISAGILAVVIRSLHAYYTVTALNELSNNASFAMDEIMRDLRQGRRVGDDGTSILVYYPVDETDFLKTAYYLSVSADGIRQLHKKDMPTSEERVLANYISSDILTIFDIFDAANNYCVAIQLLLEKTSGITRRTVDITLNSFVTLRNK